MDIPDPSAVDRQRLEISLRLKAARCLAGGVRQTKKGLEAGAVTVEELAKYPVLVENGIAKNRLDAYEQMKVPPRRMELERIADALSIDRDFLLAPLQEPRATEAIKDPTLARILEILERIQAETRERYQALEQRLGKVDPEVADEAIRLLAEARMRTGRDIGRRYRSDVHATDRPPESSTGG